MSSSTTYEDDEDCHKIFRPHLIAMLLGAFCNAIIFFVILFLRDQAEHPTLHPELFVSAFNVSSSPSTTYFNFTLTARYRDPKNTINYHLMSTNVFYGYDIPIGNRFTISSRRLNKYERRFDATEMPISKDLAEGILSDIRLYGSIRKFKITAFSRYAWWYPFDCLSLICDMIWVEFKKVNVNPRPEEVLGSLDHSIQCYYHSILCY